MPENKKFWKFCNQVGNTVELLLYGDISQTSWWGDEVTPRQFAEELAGLGRWTRSWCASTAAVEMCLPPRQSEISWSSTRRR